MIDVTPWHKTPLLKGLKSPLCLPDDTAQMTNDPSSSHDPVIAANDTSPAPSGH